MSEDDLGEKRNLMGLIYKLPHKIKSGWPVLWHSRNNLISLRDFWWLVRHEQLPLYVLQYKKYIKKFEHYTRSDYAHPIIVYQMRKVGSLTIIRTLESVLKYDILSTHFLFPENLRIAELTSVQNNSYNTKRMALLNFSRMLLKKCHTKRWKVIVTIREPVSRNISQFFHFTYLFQRDLLDYKNEEERQEKTGQLLEFFEQHRDSYNYYDMMATWFTTELKRAFGIDVFLSEFDQQKGFKIYEGEHADVLLLRLESLNLCYREAFQAFLGIEVPWLVNSNTNQERGYKEIYTQFKHAITFPSDYLDKLYSLNYVRHFYTEEEIVKFKAKWTRPGNNSL